MPASLDFVTQTSAPCRQLPYVRRSTEVPSLTITGRDTRLEWRAAVQRSEQLLRRAAAQHRPAIRTSRDVAGTNGTAGSATP